MNWKRFAALSFALLAVVLFSYQPAWSQSTIATGTVEGTITDPQGATVPAAKVTITGTSNGIVRTPPVSSSGQYNSGPLVPSEYTVRVEAPGFKTVETAVTVLVGNVASQNFKLELGAPTTVINVESSTERPNMEQVTIQGVVGQVQIENLPINGRNFLDLAQLEPGVQIQDGGNFDPTKKGFSSVSFGGRFGRTARIETDGLDVSDETVGTTTQNIPMNSIQEFQVSQSSLDIGTELTSSGTLNITTKSGTNQIHGGGFYAYRSDGTSAAIGTPPAVFDRNQYGADLGGPIIKDKVFAFGSFERLVQNLSGPSDPQAPFDGLAAAVSSPFHDTELLGRLDWNVTSSVHAFFKFTYEQNKDVASFVPNTFQPFANVDNTPAYAGGIDFTTGSFTHSIRVGYLKFRNGIQAAPIAEGPQNPAPTLALAIGNGRTSCTAQGNAFCSGLNILAPQATFQSNKQIKYDGSKVIGSHTLRYGVGYNKILGGGFASFFGLGAAVRGALNAGTEAFANGDPAGPGGDTNPLNYPVHQIVVGNGQGCFTNDPGFGQSCGGQFDTRVLAYFGDTWKILSNFSLTGGIRYVRDTGRTDSDTQAVPALNAFQAGLGEPPRQPNANFGGNIGIAWDPWKNGKTVIRAGAGIYYENAVFNNVLFDAPGRLRTGLLNGAPAVCPAGTLNLPDGTTVTTIDGLNIANQICDVAAIGAPGIITAINDLQALFQTTTAAVGPVANGNYFGAFNNDTNTGAMFAPDYRSPFSEQMNIGFQHEIRSGTIVSVDYLRNIGLHTLLGIDFNKEGDASTLNVPTALTAISQTNAGLGCGAGTDAAAINCAIGKGATIDDYANNPVSLGGGIPYTGGSPIGPGAAAFQGVNPNYGFINLMEPIGRTEYNALQVSLKSNITKPMGPVKAMNIQASYSLSRLKSMAQDVDFINQAVDYNNPGHFIGPGSLDRTNQFSFGAVFQLPYGIRTNFITHYYSGLPQTISFQPNGTPADIFQYDTIGDGQLNPTLPIPGTNIGSFGRGISATTNGVNRALEAYSTNFGNQLTPAGTALVNAGLFTEDQLRSLCAVTPVITGSVPGCAPTFNLAPPGQVGNGSLFTFDLTLGWQVKPIKHYESFSVEPTVTFYNLFNHPNYNSPLSLINGTLDNQPGSVNNTTRVENQSNLLGLGSGAFAQGAPRVIEFGIKANF